MSVYEHPLLDITIFSSLQASDASRLPLLNQQNTGVWKKGACPGYPWDAPAYNTPNALRGDYSTPVYLQQDKSAFVENN